MIANETIEAVKNIPIEDIVGRHVDLKRKGKYYFGKSPFTEEKTASFSVTPSRGIFKCFSSEKSGDGISFIQQLKGFSFTDAIKDICQSQGIQLQYIQGDIYSAEEKKKREEAYKKKEAIQALLDFALTFFQLQEFPDKFRKVRKFTLEVLDQYKIGYAPHGNKLLEALRKNQYSIELAIEAGLIGRNDEKEEYDYFRGRVIFPIFDRWGKVLAFTGRTDAYYFKSEEEDLKKNKKHVPQKYFNSPDSVWEKGKNLYALNIAKDHINKLDYAILVEGTTDVMRLAEHEYFNAVAPCGTAFTDDQIALLKKHTLNVCIIADNDISKKAGKKGKGVESMESHAIRLLHEGFRRVEVIIPPVEGQDPDGYLKVKRKDEVDKFINSRMSFLDEYLLNYCTAQGALGAVEKTEVIRWAGEIIENIPDDLFRQSAYENLCRQWKPFNQYKLPKKAKEVELPKNIGKESMDDFFEFDFYEKDNCYYTYEKRGERRICAFTMQYLYFVVTDDIPLYVIKFQNTFGRSTIKAFTTDETIVASEFRKQVSRLYGRFLFEGREEDLNRINLKLRKGVKKADEPQQIGYNIEHDFYIWGNGILYNNELLKANEFGVVEVKFPLKSEEDFLKVGNDTVIDLAGKDYLIESPEVARNDLGDKLTTLIESNQVNILKYFFLPFADTKGLANNVDGSAQKLFTLNMNNKINFEKWAELLNKVHGEHAKLMIGYYMMSLFRDIIYKHNNSYCPLLSLFGPPGTGKSTAGRSLARMWGSNHCEEEGMNINNDTTRGIESHVDKFQNAIIWINEFSRNIEKDRVGKLELLKTFAGGSERKTRSTKNYKSNNAKNRNGTIISGQDSVNFDPGLHDRCIPLKFEPVEHNKEAFTTLKGFEENGLCTQVTAELLRYRKVVEKKYTETAKKVRAELERRLKIELDKGRMSYFPDERIILNTESVVAPIVLFSDLLKYPFTVEQVYINAIENIRYKVSIKKSNNEVATFFSVVAAAGLVYGNHYKIEKENDGTGRMKLFLRLRLIMPLYRSASQRQGMSPFNESDIKDMLLMHKAAVETEKVEEKYKLGDRSKGVNFPRINKTNTSALVMDYGILAEDGLDVLNQEVNDYAKDQQTTSSYSKKTETTKSKTKEMQKTIEGTAHPLDDFFKTDKIKLTHFLKSYKLKKGGTDADAKKYLQQLIDKGYASQVRHDWAELNQKKETIKVSHDTILKILKG
ncbi:CHC2 zinc finger domain-containing protein [Flammeovirga aprica]|uniref:Toprim domain-containing protein n=1 Tax=Flammeovirga aprica JL-4 TaxID=694437 RepID=A0A7X9RQX4_9BACT|nr:CHC2 zinc finger domain-containing protein [Flammeovirga aprica]NME67218.1 toprim domain-containing protein [Flammeovirga aprica JL-4]